MFCGYYETAEVAGMLKKRTCLLVCDRPGGFSVTSSSTKIKFLSYLVQKTEMTNEIRKHELTLYWKYWKVLPQESRSVEKCFKRNSEVLRKYIYT